MTPTKPYEFVDNDLFAKKGSLKLYGEALLPPLPTAKFFEVNEKPTGRTYVMAREEEIGRFLELNFAKRMFNATLRSQRALPSRLAFWHMRVRHLEEYLTRVNLPLVYSLVSRNLQRYIFIDWEEAVSEGSTALMRSLSGFNVLNGCKFSTYGCQAILHSLSSINAKAAKRRSRLQTVELPDEFGDSTASTTSQAEEEVEGLLNALRTNAARLSDTELTVLRYRFALEGFDRLTLEEVGTLIGVSKERVRQIQEKSLGKLRAVLLASATD